MTEVHFARATDLSRMIYSAAPFQRLGAMKDILGHVPHDSGLRRILTDPSLLKEPPRPDNRLNIAKAASAYTKKFFGVSIVTYIKQVKEGAVNEEFVILRACPVAAPVREPRAPQRSPITSTTSSLSEKAECTLLRTCR
ncbi:hypothetical protein SAMN04488002_1149 [Litoreibacter janthinus]|uniref:Uncharacterized protein n=1 Tax=Litoreibacter janthinus TaxID=670154 RepID=A0A1I6GAE8_9RHOB|nr:hypothetical protein SAMN04488002_1149 [Litoreibacter janthinus]